MTTYSWKPEEFRLGLWADLGDVFLLFNKLVVNLLDLVLQDLQLTLLIFKLLRVEIYFALQARRLTFVDGVVATTHRTSCN